MFVLNGGASVTLAIPDIGGSASIEGWALVASDNMSVSGQETFLRRFPGLPDFEVSVPLTQPQTCIVPFPSTGKTVLQFDNKGHATAVALANVTSSAQSVAVEFDDQAGNSIMSTTISLKANGHSSFLLTGYPALVGTSGAMIVSGSPDKVSLIGLWVNQKSGTLSAMTPTLQ
jgi:hypothetical protein